MSTVFRVSTPTTSPLYLSVAKPSSKQAKPKCLDDHKHHHIISFIEWMNGPEDLVDRYTCAACMSSVLAPARFTSALARPFPSLASVACFSPPDHHASRTNPDSTGHLETGAEIASWWPGYAANVLSLLDVVSRGTVHSSVNSHSPV